MNPPTAAPAPKPKPRFWRWVLIGFSVIGVLAVIGLVSLFALLAGSAQHAATVSQSNVRTMALKAAPMMAPSYDAAESAGGNAGVSYSYAANGGTAGGDMMMPPEPAPVQTAGPTAAEVDQKIIKDGSLQLTVRDVGDTLAKITAMAAGRGGYVQNSSASEREDGTHYGQIAVRVPAKDFDQAMAEIKTYALVVKNETATGQDVTEQYTDLEAQLRNAQAQEKTYLAVLDKAKTVEDILKVQQYLSQVRGTIESLQGRIQYLTNVTSYSTISVYLEEEPVIKVPTKEFRPLTELKAAVQALIDSLQKLAVSAIWAVVLGGGLLLPFVLLVLLVVWIVLRVLRRRRQTK